MQANGISRLMKTECYKNLINFEINKTPLRMIALEYSDIADSTVMCLASSKLNNTIIYFSLKGCFNITDNGLIVFFQSQNFQLIKYMDLSETKITDNLSVVLSRSKNSLNLKKLQLNSCEKITSEFFLNIIDSAHLVSIKYCSFENCNLEEINLANLSYEPHRILLIKHSRLPKKLYCLNLTESH